MREMKDSGVEWIGEIPQNWNTVRLKYTLIADKNSMKVGPFGSQLKGTDFVTEGIPVYNQRTVLDNEFDISTAFISKEKFDTLTGFEVQPLDILITTRGTIGKIAIAPENVKQGIIHPCIIKFAVNDAMINRNLLKYIFNDTTVVIEQLILASNATTIPVVYSEPLKNVYLPLTDLEEQERILNFLDSKCSKIDEIIQKQQEIIDKLKEYRLSIINEAVTQGINPDVNMKQSGYKWIGSIPEHWNMVYAKQLFSQRKDRAFENDEQLTASQKYGVISQKEFMDIEGRQVMQVLKGEEILKHVEKGDFVISMRSFQGGLEYSEVSGKISSAYVMLIPNRDKVYDRYYKWLFKSKKYISALQGTSNLIRDGQALRFSNFVQVYLPSFDLDEQKQIADYLDDICPKLDNEIEKREKLLEKVMEYKKSLIYEVVTGKKEV